MDCQAVTADCGQLSPGSVIKPGQRCWEGLESGGTNRGRLEPERPIKKVARELEAIAMRTKTGWLEG